MASAQVDKLSQTQMQNVMLNSCMCDLRPHLLICMWSDASVNGGLK